MQVHVMNLPAQNAANNCFATLWMVTKLSVAPAIFEMVQKIKTKKN